MELTVNTVGGIIAIIIGIITIIGILLHQERRYTKLESQVKHIVKELNEIKPVRDAMITLLNISRNPISLELAKQIHPPEEKRNPYDLKEKEKLLKNIKTGPLT